MENRNLRRNFALLNFRDCSLADLRRGDQFAREAAVFGSMFFDIALDHEVKKKKHKGADHAENEAGQGLQVVEKEAGLGKIITDSAPDPVEGNDKWVDYCIAVSLGLYIGRSFSFLKANYTVHYVLLWFFRISEDYYVALLKLFTINGSDDNCII